MLHIMGTVMGFLVLSLVTASPVAEPSNEVVSEDVACAVSVNTSGGVACGAIRTSYNGAPYASFRGLPYARQPLGELRFVAPQPLEPWNGYFNATVEGPVCPQREFLYGKMMQPRSMGEDCLRANVHVPEHALPKSGTQCSGEGCLPVLVFIPGGGFVAGSGDSDVNGPEYMIDQDVVVVTFNYRIGPFGFLWLNTTSVPGNTGLRDMLAALQWLQTNARAFGGDPDRVTIMGQSAAGSAAHILSLSEATKGLFNKAILMSGTAISFYSTSTRYAEQVRSAFLMNLNISSTDPEEIHRTLISLPLETIVDADENVRKTFGMSSFAPVVESQFDGVTRILDSDPDVLIASGRGNNYPLFVGFANVEFQSLRRTLEDINALAALQKNATAILPFKLLFTLSQEKRDIATKRLTDWYFNGTPTLDEYILANTESGHVYPTIKLSEMRAGTGGAPVFMYQFSYSSNFTALKQALGLQYQGAGHLEDLSYVFRVNSILQDTKLNKSDEDVKNWITSLIGNFIRCSSPTCELDSAAWPAAANPLRYQDISGAAYSVSSLTPHQQDILQLYDSLYEL